MSVKRERVRKRGSEKKLEYHRKENVITGLLHVMCVRSLGRREMDERKSRQRIQKRGRIVPFKRFSERCERVNDSTKRCSYTREGEKQLS